jgi:hypothetical protein
MEKADNPEATALASTGPGEPYLSQPMRTHHEIACPRIGSDRPDHLGSDGIAHAGGFRGGQIAWCFDNRLHGEIYGRPVGSSSPALSLG